MFLAFVIALIAYVIASVHLWWALVQVKPVHRGLTLGLLVMGMLAHAATLYPLIVTARGLNFNLFHTASLVGLFFLAFYAVFASYRPVLSLGVLATPLAMIGLCLGYFGDAPYQPIALISGGMTAHILLSIAAYCVLLMATVQAVILKFQIRELKHRTSHRLWVNKLPPLQSMESLLFDMIVLGFGLLTLALGMGFVYVHDLLAQHIAHKTVLSVVSWLVYGGLIIGHWRAGLRGKRAANLTIIAFVLLAVGFLGSKFVLEIILT